MYNDKDSFFHFCRQPLYINDAVFCFLEAFYIFKRTNLIIVGINACTIRVLFYMELSSLNRAVCGTAISSSVYICLYQNRCPKMYGFRPYL